MTAITVGGGEIVRSVFTSTRLRSRDNSGQAKRAANQIWTLTAGRTCIRDRAHMQPEAALEACRFPV